jgi:hypothetical protein
MTLTGAQFRELLNQQWKGQDPQRPRIGQVSGFTYTWDASKPAGEKVIDIKKLDGTSVQDSMTYTITVNDFMASGGDKYVLLKQGTNRMAGPVDLDATLQYIKDNFTTKGLPITAAVENRFTKIESKPAAKDFKDVAPTYWAYNVIKQLSIKNVINGKTDDEFAPLQNVSRAEFAAMLVRGLGLKETATIQFTDVPSTYGLAKEIAAASKAGIIDGVSETQFAPDKTIKREEMATMIVRAYEIKSGTKAKSTKTAGFNDLPEVSAWAKVNVNIAAELGFIQGRQDGIFDPKGEANRAESAQIIYNILYK